MAHLSRMAAFHLLYLFKIVCVLFVFFSRISVSVKSRGTMIVNADLRTGISEYIPINMYKYNSHTHVYSPMVGADKTLGSIVLFFILH